MKIKEKIQDFLSAAFGGRLFNEYLCSCLRMLEMITAGLILAALLPQQPELFTQTLLWGVSIALVCMFLCYCKEKL